MKVDCDYAGENRYAAVRAIREIVPAWGAELPGVKVAATLEVAYANARGAEVNAESARAFGADLARAIQVWLREDR